MPMKDLKLHRPKNVSNETIKKSWQRRNKEADIKREMELVWTQLKGKGRSS